MIALLICLAVLGVAVAVLLVARRHEAGWARQQRAKNEAELARSGLTPTLGFFSWSLAGTREGVPISVEGSTSQPLPGHLPGGDSSVSGTWLLGQSSGADVIVCRRDLTEVIVGPLSAVPRHPTGDADFDARYDVLASGAGLDAGEMPSAPARRALVGAGLAWLRRKDGRLEMMTRSLSGNQAAALVSLGLGLCRPGPGREILPMPAAAEPVGYPSLTMPLYAALGSLVVVGPAGAILCSLFPPVQALFLDLGCPAGFVIEGTSSNLGDGTSYGAICRHGTEWRELSAGFFFACGALTAALAALVGLGASARRLLARLAQERQLAVS
jgi:hypothetical protein